MYNAFFGLNSQPFSIAPNPEFMYLGSRHTEALAHLRYGLGDAGGFVLLTGEVGTGKTTVSRCLLAELPEHTQVAFVLNPTLSELELLAAICDELKIRYKKTDASLKLLTDKITTKLQKNHQAGINTILIIDEAQHLQPAVLEQLRLLTNLETNTKKLLQVILIGQPELQQLLQRQDLRQLAQRITARYHLMPLTLAEVKYYVEHRLQVAGCSRPVFTDSALKKLFEFSGGIPRLLNLLCDRALLGGYSQQKALIDGKMIELAAAEILAIKPAATKAELPVWLWPLLFVLCLALGVSLSLLWLQH
jgi:general secretion pathway protein A